MQFDLKLNRILSEYGDDSDYFDPSGFVKILKMAESSYRIPSGHMRIPPTARADEDHSYHFPAILLADLLDSKGEYDFAKRIRRLVQNDYRNAAFMVRRSTKDEDIADIPEEQVIPHFGNHSFCSQMMQVLARIRSTFDDKLRRTRRSNLVPPSQRTTFIKPYDIVSYNSADSPQTQRRIESSLEANQQPSIDIGSTVFQGKVVGTDWEYAGVGHGPWDRLAGVFSAKPMDEEDHLELIIVSPKKFAGHRIDVPIGILIDPPYIDRRNIADVFEAWADFHGS